MFVLDARFIDQSDNTAVSTWADRSGNGYDVSQATSANRPTLQTGEVGGSSIVRFDGINDYLSRSDAGFPTADLTAIGVHKQNNALASSEFRSVFHYGQNATGKSLFYIYGDDGNFGNDAFGVSQFGNGIAIAASTGAYIVGTVTRSGSDYSVRKNSGNASTKSMTTLTATHGTNGFAVGSFNAALSFGSYLNGDIGTIMLFSSSISDSLRKKLERTCGLVWKISCN